MTANYLLLLGFIFFGVCLCVFIKDFPRRMLEEEEAGESEGEEPQVERHALATARLPQADPLVPGELEMSRLSSSLTDLPDFFPLIWHQIRTRALTDNPLFHEFVFRVDKSEMHDTSRIGVCMRQAFAAGQRPAKCDVAVSLLMLNNASSPESPPEYKFFYHSFGNSGLFDGRSLPLISTVSELERQTRSALRT